MGVARGAVVSFWIERDGPLDLRCADGNAGGTRANFSLASRAAGGYGRSNGHVEVRVINFPFSPEPARMRARVDSSAAGRAQADARVPQ
jgi:hypothetical protein